MATERLQAALSLAAELAGDFAARAAGHDAANTFPFENYRRLRETGYTALPVPEELGGGGLTLPELCAAQERLARGCGATALGVNMHLFGLGAVVDRRGEGSPQLDALLGAVASQRLILAGSFSEAETGGNWLHATARAERTGFGFKINGRKIFCSLSPVMDFYLGSARWDDAPDGPRILDFVIPRGTPGLEIQDDWDAMGMRATGSNSVVYRDLLVADPFVVRQRPPGVVEDFMGRAVGWFGLTVAAVYTGIARAARDFAVGYTRDRRRYPYPAPMSHFPGQQFLAAEMDIGLRASDALIRETAEDLAARREWGPPEVAAALAAKQFATRTAVDVVDRAMSMAGGSGYARRSPLERYYRDVRAGRFHPPAEHDALGIIGKVAFDIPLDVEPRWV